MQVCIPSSDCEVCFEQIPPSGWQFLPCTHKLCLTCYKNLTGIKTCPWCRVNIATLEKMARKLDPSITPKVSGSSSSHSFDFPLIRHRNHHAQTPIQDPMRYQSSFINTRDTLNNPDEVIRYERMATERLERRQRARERRRRNRHER